MTTSRIDNGCGDCARFMATDPRGRQVAIAAGIYAGLLANPLEMGGDALPVKMAEVMGREIVRAYVQVFHEFDHIPLEIVTDDMTAEVKQTVVDQMFTRRHGGAV